eukprot:4226333-Pleurochrysis_carterae.AAC.1
MRRSTTSVSPTAMRVGGLSSTAAGGSGLTPTTPPRRRGRRTPRVAVSERVVQLGECARAVDDGYICRLHGIHVRVLCLVRPGCVGGHTESGVDGEALRRGPPADQLDYFVRASRCSQRAC